MCCSFPTVFFSFSFSFWNNEVQNSNPTQNLHFSFCHFIKQKVGKTQREKNLRINGWDVETTRFICNNATQSITLHTLQDLRSSISNFSSFPFHLCLSTQSSRSLPLSSHQGTFLIFIFVTIIDSIVLHACDSSVSSAVMWWYCGAKIGWTHSSIEIDKSRLGSILAYWSVDK